MFILRRLYMSHASVQSNVRLPQFVNSHAPHSHIPDLAVGLIMIVHFPPSLSLCRRRPQHRIAVGHIFSWLGQVLVRRMSTSSPPQVAKQPRPPPSKPRPSASLIIINPQNEILLVQRNPRAGTFAGAYVGTSWCNSLFGCSGIFNHNNTC